MAVQHILLLGHPKLFQKAEMVRLEELEDIKNIVKDLHDTLVNFRQQYGSGRAIAAPQIGVMKRIIYMYIDEPILFINPQLTFKDLEKIEVWDDCMSFPNLLVKVNRYKRCRIHYKDIEWKEHSMEVEGDLSELIQHEYDHLDGILAVSHAIDGQSFSFKNNKKQS